jgi:hypothetical protein
MPALSLRTSLPIPAAVVHAVVVALLAVVAVNHGLYHKQF